MNGFHLPPEGIYLGSGVYPTETDTLLCTMVGHYTWQTQYFSSQEMIEKIVSDNQGNLAQVWGYPRGFSPRVYADWIYALDEIGVTVGDPDWENGKDLTIDDVGGLLEKYADRKGAGLLRFIREAKKRGIYTTFLYTDAAEGVSRQLAGEGDWYLGYDFGERYNIGLSEAQAILQDAGKLTLTALSDSLIRRVREHTDERRRTGWGHIMTTSANFSIDYEVLGGADIPMMEDFAFPNLNFASGYARGLFRQHGLPVWGSHLAHEHYSWLPVADPRRQGELRLGLYLKMMAGAKILINESGNWFCEATLAPDSPKLAFPQTAREQFGSLGWGESRRLMHEQPQALKPLLEEAKPYFGTTDYSSDYCRAYRETISGVWDFVKAHPAPQGQPETVTALVKGNNDLTSANYNPNYAISGLYDIALEDPNWFQCAPEVGWQTARSVFFPTPDVLTPYSNIQLSGTPYGQVDVISFARDRVTAEQLLKQYKTLIFTGYNTCSEEQYRILCDYVRGGGTLFLAVPQLSTDDARRLLSYTADDLVRGGDVSELCGVKVTGRGRNIYWAFPRKGDHRLEDDFPRRYGILGVPLAQIEITDPSLEIVVTDDEEDEPVLIRHTLGKGVCYLMTTWTYPGAAVIDEGPGGKTGSGGLFGAVLRMLGRENRPQVYLTGEGAESGCLNVSYFPDCGQICLCNIDFEKPHEALLHVGGRTMPVTVGAAEYRVLDTEGRLLAVSGQ